MLPGIAGGLSGRAGLIKYFTDTVFLDGTTWTAPLDAGVVRFSLIGAGGASGYYDYTGYSNFAYSGGGGGSFASGAMAVTPGETFNLARVTTPQPYQTNADQIPTTVKRGTYNIALAGSGRPGTFGGAASFEQSMNPIHYLGGAGGLSYGGTGGGGGAAGSTGAGGAGQPNGTPGVRGSGVTWIQTSDGATRTNGAGNSIYGGGGNMNLPGTIGMIVAEGLNPGIYSPAVAAYLANMAVEPDDTRKGLIASLIDGLISDGVWAKLDDFTLLAAHDQQAGLLNAVVPNRFTKSGSSTFTTDRGFAGATTGQYNLTKAQLPVTTSGSKATLNSFSFGFYVNVMGSSSNAGSFPMYSDNYSQQTSRYVWESGTHHVRINNAGGPDLSYADTTRLGHWTAVRSDANTVSMYKNGAVVASLSSRSSSAVATTNSNQSVGGDYYYQSDRFAAFYCGSGLTAGNVASLQTRLSTYMNAIGAA